MSADDATMPISASPFLSRLTTSILGLSVTVTNISGFCRRNDPSNCGMCSESMLVFDSRRIVPPRPSEKASSSTSSFLVSSSTLRAWPTRMSPASVGLMPRPVRSTSGSPKLTSILRSRALTAATTILFCKAAAVRLPPSTAERNILRSVRSNFMVLSFHNW
ncbi:hypothetical protein D3C73_841340 [compost metagenome]